MVAIWLGELSGAARENGVLMVFTIVPNATWQVLLRR
jgi:hypothetical protein